MKKFWNRICKIVNRRRDFERKCYEDYLQNYSAHYYCVNCFQLFFIKLPRGTKQSDHESTCTHCGFIAIHETCRNQGKYNLDCHESCGSSTKDYGALI